MTALHFLGTVLIFLPMLVGGLLFLRRERARQIRAVGPLSRVGRLFRIGTGTVFVFVGGVQVSWSLFVLADVWSAPELVGEAKPRISSVDMQTPLTPWSPFEGLPTSDHRGAGTAVLRVELPEGEAGVGHVPLPHSRICVSYRVGVLTGKVRPLDVIGITEDEFVKHDRSCKKVMESRRAGGGPGQTQNAAGWQTWDPREGTDRGSSTEEEVKPPRR